MNRSRVIIMVSGLTLVATAFALILVPTPRVPPAVPDPHKPVAVPSEPAEARTDDPQPNRSPDPIEEQPADPDDDTETVFYQYIDGELERIELDEFPILTDDASPPEEENEDDAATPAYPRLADPEYRARRVEELTRRREEARKRALAWAERTGEPMRIETNGTVIILIDYTDETGPIYRSTLNLNAGISTATDLVRAAPYSLSGAGITAGIWDGGNVRSTHTEFVSGRVANFENFSLSDHATHVAGTMIARGASASAVGMATNAILHAYEFNDDIVDMTARAMAVPGETNKIQISNHSYGFLAGWAWQWSPVRWYGTWPAPERESDYFGRYSQDDRDVDQLLYDAPYYLPVYAAGNDRNDSAPSPGATFQYWNQGPPGPTGWTSKSYDPNSDPYNDGWKAGGYNTIPFGTVAKNTLVVGAISNAVTAGARDLGKGGMSEFSAWGPTDDGRIKPDIVANGVSLYSSSSAGNTSYNWKSGTSMAAPNASGSAILLLEHYGNLFPGEYMRASTIKALIIHTADDLGDPGPDFRFGWGLMNTKAAVDHISRHHEYPDAQHMIEDIISTTNAVIEYEIHWDNESPLRATMAWTDPPGPARTGLNNTNTVLINDLDLRIIAPNGTTNYPWTFENPTNYPPTATTGDNFRDNVEQVYIEDPPTAGVYTIRITHKGTLQDNRQHYSLMISGGTEGLHLDHVPLINTGETNLPYTVDVYIAPTQRLDAAQTELRWNTTGDTNDFHTNAFTWITDNLYRAEIPAQPPETEIFYYIRAVTTNGTVTTDPVDAPASLHAFQVTEDVKLVVTGTPAEIGTADPPYGTNLISRGNTVNASAGPFTDPDQGTRHRVTGWLGAGSTPEEGFTNQVSFVIEEHSSLDWQWTIQYALVQTSSVAGLVETIAWWDENDSADTIAAPGFPELGGTLYAFAEWRVDDVRQDDERGVSINPATDIPMSAPRAATAVYFPEDQDTDGEGLPDWWQIYYFGELGVDPNADADGDGWTNFEEYLDGTDPLDTNSFPTPPAIDHTPLPDPQGELAPWPVSAVITDNHAVASATLWWNRNDEGWNSDAMTESETPDVYTNAIPEPGIKGDSFTYYITASDAAGLTATNGPHTFDVAFPVLVVSPEDEMTFLLQPGSLTHFVFSVSNEGHAALNWMMTVEESVFVDDMESGEGDWTHFGDNDHWHISTNRSWSSTHAWYNGLPGTREYEADMYAFLVLPPLALHDEGSTLTFQHWIDAEETEDPAWAYHGGLVAISPDDGDTFYLIEPVGGYPFGLYDTDLSVYSGYSDWEQAEFDLTDFAGETVLIAFVFISDNLYFGHEGWYIDDVEIAPLHGGGDWLTPATLDGTLEPFTATGHWMTVSAENMASGENYTRIMRVEGNDPIEPVRHIPVHLQVQSTPVVDLVSAAQTSTDGSGLVTITNAVFDPEGNAVELEILFSTNDGAAWDPAWILDVSASIGEPEIDNESSNQVSDVWTELDGVPATNNLAIVWDTTNGPDPIVLSTNVTLRIRAFDGVTWSEPAVSEPFLVDNEPPTAPTGLASSTHTADVWSVSDALTGEWDASDDGDGIGVAGYGVDLLIGTGAPPITVTTTGLTHTAADLADGTNWWLGVHAIDEFGNISEAAYLGPFRIDATPPDAEFAVIEIESSPFGNYTFSVLLTNSWSGFADVMSGIAGYYSALADGSGTTNGFWTTDTSGVLGDSVLDQTNTVYVWARDIAGNIGDAASADIIVLTKEGDWDGTGMSNWQKEIAGLDATDPDQIFQAEGAVEDPETDELVLRWPFAAGRVYTIYWAEDSLADPGLTWHTIPDPGYTVTNGFAVWADTNTLENANGHRFYRVEVELGE